MNFARQETHSHEITTISFTNQSLDLTKNPLKRIQSTQLSPMAMAGGGELGSGQIPTTGLAGGEGQGEEKHEEISGYAPVVLGGLEMAGGRQPT
jgi:hypothetical protein